MQKDKPLISVIVPIYNAEPYLRKCIDSILAQTYPELEVILVDDGSSDQSGVICEEYAQRDKRIIVIHQENTGQAGARNHGLSIATGKYVGFVDSDDWIAPEMYQTLLDSLLRNDGDLAVCGRYTVKNNIIKTSNGFNLSKETVMTTEEAIERFMTYKAIDSSCWDKLYKKALLSDIRFPLGYICEDVPFVYDALTKAKKIVHCAKPLYYVLIRSGSTSRSSFNHKGMGLYYYFRDVSQKCKRDFPRLTHQADYLFFKNLLVLACRIARSRENVAERHQINGEVRKNIQKILTNKKLKKSYKILALAIEMHIERLAIKIAEFAGVNLA